MRKIERFGEDITWSTVLVLGDGHKFEFQAFAQQIRMRALHHAVLQSQFQPTRGSTTQSLSPTNKVLDFFLILCMQVCDLSLTKEPNAFDSNRKALAHGNPPGRLELSRTPT